jgi:N-acyl homoserine lactone hydrolase
MIKIHAIQTGRVKVKQFQATGAKFQITRLWQLLFTNTWSEWLPVYCWLIEHPAGPFLIDAGEIDKVNEHGYLPDNIIFKGAAKYEICREDEVDIQLEKIGYKTEQIRGIFLTHFHSDHVDGVRHFPNAKIFASKAAYDFLLSPQGAGLGYFKEHLPVWFRPETFEFGNDKDDIFTTSKNLLSDGSIIAVPMPGHSSGHTAYIVKSKERRFIFSGDTTFTRTTMIDGIPFVILNNAESEASVDRLRKYSQSSDVVVLCSHDPQAAKTLETITW